MLKPLIIVTVLFIGHHVFCQDQLEKTEVKNFKTVYVHSFQELITELQKRKETITTSVFFVSYDESGYIIHSVSILIPKLIEFIRAQECNMPPFCVVLMGDEAIRKID